MGRHFVRACWMINKSRAAIMALLRPPASNPTSCARPCKTASSTGQGRSRTRIDFSSFVSRRSRGVSICRSEEHTSELQSLMRISYAVFCLKKKKKKYIAKSKKKNDKLNKNVGEKIKRTQLDSE